MEHGTSESRNAYILLRQRQSDLTSQNIYLNACFCLMMLCVIELAMLSNKKKLYSCIAKRIALLHGLTVQSSEAAKSNHFAIQMDKSPAQVRRDVPTISMSTTSSYTYNCVVSKNYAFDRDDTTTLERHAKSDELSVLQSREKRILSHLVGHI